MTANRMREAWFLNRFIPLDRKETQVLDDLKKQLNFDPYTESHRLRSTSQEGADRIRNPKIIVAQLTGGKMEREQKCWEETCLELLRKRGIHTGLTDYIREIEQRFVPIVRSE